MSRVVADLAAAYSERSPLVHINVSDQGTQYGLRALAMGEVDLAMASWLPDELNGDWHATAIARDGIAVIVHPENPLDSLGIVQLQSLFSGRVYEWRALDSAWGHGETQLLSRERGSGDRNAFESLVMDAEDVAPMAIVLASDDAVVEYVAGHPGAIGYVSRNRLTPQVKALKIEGVPPSSDSISDGSYPIVRDWWLVAGRESDAAQDFIDFCLSPAGQEIITRAQGRTLN
jgi:phosphate transport system substrate-binding protein